MPKKPPPRRAHFQQDQLRVGSIRRDGIAAPPLGHRITAGGTGFGFRGNLFAAFGTSDQCHEQPREVGVEEMRLRIVFATHVMKKRTVAQRDAESKKELHSEKCLQKFQAACWSRLLPY